MLKCNSDVIQGGYCQTTFTITIANLYVIIVLNGFYSKTARSNVQKAIAKNARISNT